MALTTAHTITRNDVDEICRIIARLPQPCRADAIYHIGVALAQWDQCSGHEQEYSEALTQLVHRHEEEWENPLCLP